MPASRFSRDFVARHGRRIQNLNVYDCVYWIFLIVCVVFVSEYNVSSALKRISVKEVLFTMHVVNIYAKLL